MSVYEHITEIGTNNLSVLQVVNYVFCLKSTLLTFSCSIE